MGDFEKYNRINNKFVRIRVPILSDEQNSEINRVYFGNPFKLLLISQKPGAINHGGPNTGMLLQNAEINGAFDERAFEHAGGADTPMPSNN